MTTDINSVILSLNLDMQQAATAHFRSLLAYEARTRLARHQLVPDHVCGEGSGGAAGRRVFGDPVFRRKHPGIGPLSRWRKQEHAEGLALGALQTLQAR